MTPQQEAQIIKEAYERFPILDNGHGDANEKKYIVARVDELLNDKS